MRIKVGVEPTFVDTKEEGHTQIGCTQPCMSLPHKPTVAARAMAKGATVRVNARLDAARTAKLRQLQSSLRIGASEVVERALDLLHKEQCQGKVQERRQC